MHPLTVAVTEIVPEIGEDVGLVAENEGGFPVPLAPRPIAVLLLLHANVPPGGTLA